MMDDEKFEEAICEKVYVHDYDYLDPSGEYFKSKKIHVKAFFVSASEYSSCHSRKFLIRIYFSYRPTIFKKEKSVKREDFCVFTNILINDNMSKSNEKYFLKICKILLGGDMPKFYDNKPFTAYWNQFIIQHDFYVDGYYNKNQDRYSWLYVGFVFKKLIRARNEYGY